MPLTFYDQLPDLWQSYLRLDLIQDLKLTLNLSIVYARCEPRCQAITSTATLPTARFDSNKILSQV